MGPIVLFETSRIRLIEYSRYRDSNIVIITVLTFSLFPCFQDYTQSQISTSLSRLVFLIAHSLYQQAATEVDAYQLYKKKLKSLCTSRNMYFKGRK